jgi:hypothetical protein
MASVSLQMAGYQPAWVDLSRMTSDKLFDNGIKALVCADISCVSIEEEKQLVDFVQKGGFLIFFEPFGQYDARGVVKVVPTAQHLFSLAGLDNNAIEKEKITKYPKTPISCDKGSFLSFASTDLNDESGKERPMKLPKLDFVSCIGDSLRALKTTPTVCVQSDDFAEKANRMVFRWKVPASQRDFVLPVLKPMGELMKQGVTPAETGGYTLVYGGQSFIVKGFGLYWLDQLVGDRGK